MMPEAILRALAEWTLRATVLAALVGALLWLLRVRDVSVRLAAWTVVLAGALLVPVVTALAPQVPVLVPKLSMKQDPEAVLVTTAPGAPVQKLEPPAAMTSGLVAPRPPGSQAPRWPMIGISVWAAVAGAMLFRLSLGLWLSRRLVGASREIKEGVRESSAVTVPIVVGVMRPVILLPPDWCEWEQDKLRAVLVHERAHLRRRDPVRQIAASVYRSLCWFHPLAWWLHAHLTELAEAASDDAALRATQDGSLYAETLLGFFGRAPRRVQWEGIAMARSGKVTRRMERILDSGRRLSDALTRGALIALVVGAVPLVYLAASARPVWAVVQDVAAPAPPAPPAAPDTAMVTATPSARPAASDSRRGELILAAGENWSSAGDPDQLDYEQARALRNRAGKDIIWFRHDGAVYVIKDEATVREAQRIFAPLKSLGGQMGRIGSELGQSAGLYAAVPKPNEALTRIKELSARISQQATEVEKTDDPEALARIEGNIRDLEQRIRDQRAKIKEYESRIREIERQVGDRGPVFERMRELERQSKLLSEKVEHAMQELLQQTLRTGQAERVR